MPEETGSDVSRRRALRAVGAGIVGTGGLSSVASADSSGVSSDKQAEVIRHVQEDSEVKRLVEFARSRGWEPQFGSTSVFEFDVNSLEVSEELKQNSGQMTTAVVSFERTESIRKHETIERIELVWSDTGVVSSKLDSKDTTFISELSTRGEVAEFRSYRAKQGDVELLNTGSITRESDDTTANSTCGTGDFKLYCYEFPRISCILGLLGTSIGCGTCIMGNVPGCLSCALGHGSSVFAGCFVKNCDVVCAPKFTEPSGGDGYVPDSEEHVSCDGKVGPEWECNDYSIS